MMKGVGKGRLTRDKLAPCEYGCTTSLLLVDLTFSWPQWEARTIPLSLVILISTTVEP